MQGSSEIQRILNAALRDQLTAINQFFLHARIVKNWGLGGLNEHAYKRSIKAMKWADELIERILFLQGLPNLQDLDKLLIGEDTPEIIRNDLALQTGIRSSLLSAIADSERMQDYLSRDLLEEVLEGTESHIDWLESQQWLIEHSGLENYLQSMMQ